MNQIKLESGVYLTENEYIAHSPDFKFMAGGKDENGICTSYSFRDVDLSIFAKFINKNKLKRIVFQYGFDGHEGPFTIDLNKIDDYSSLESISFDLAKDAFWWMPAPRSRLEKSWSVSIRRMSYCRLPPPAHRLELAEAEVGRFRELFTRRLRQSGCARRP